MGDPLIFRELFRLPFKKLGRHKRSVVGRSGHSFKDHCEEFGFHAGGFINFEVIFTSLFLTYFDLNLPKPFIGKSSLQTDSSS